MPRNRPPPKTSGTQASLILPDKPHLAAAVLEIADDLGDRIGSHGEHSETCPWRDREMVLYGFALAVSHLLVDMMCDQEWEEEEIDGLLETVRSNAFSLLKSVQDS